ncbi:MAG: hypothetical protein K2I70_00945 [Bacilli bacterium]|nr:hypothetical protein [Bacilli bacterium]
MATTKKKTTKKGTTAKKQVKTATEEKKEIKEEIKKDEVKKESKIRDSLKRFFNHPAPLIIILICIVLFLTMYIADYNSKNKIYVGSLDKKDIAIVNVHFFLNGDMNYFHAANAAYLGEDKEIYTFQIGYYAVDSNNNYYELATRANSLENKTSLKDVIDENSGWSFAESDKGILHFTEDVRKNIDNIHFVVKASTEKGSTNPDIVIDYPVDLEKITK